MTRTSTNRDVAAYLDSLSTLSRRGFSTLQAAREAILQLVTVTMHSSLFSLIRQESGNFAVVAAHNAPGNYLNRVQSDFVSIVNHEFRTTLTAIQGFSELIRDEEFSFQEIKEYASDINMDARRLSRMINQLLDLDQMKLGQIQLHFEEVDLNEIILSVVQRIRPTVPAHHIRVHLDDQLPLLSGDYDKLSLVVTNLLNNAIKYSPTGGEILLCSHTEDTVVRVSVQDHGVGIPTHALEQVFEMHARSYEAGSPRYIKGTGLGLPMVRQIVQMHAGKTWAESLSDQGSVFYFTLPISSEAVQAEEYYG
jgi:signal transduction histidine kinase